MDAIKIDNLLSQMRATAALAAGGVKPGERAAAAPADFASVLKASIDQVNRSQTEATQLAREFELGGNANLHEVMIALQKSNISFQQMVQVRNRLVSAYHDIMNMQV